MPRYRPRMANCDSQRSISRMLNTYLSGTSNASELKFEAHKPKGLLGITEDELGSQGMRCNMQSRTKAEQLFDNLVTVPELIVLASHWLHRPIDRPINRNTVYKWVRRGMPNKKIGRELFFPRDEAALWLQRTN